MRVDELKRRTAQMEQIEKLVARAIAVIDDPGLRVALGQRLVAPRSVIRNWDYAENVQHECWIIAEDFLSKTSIAYCNNGFGPDCPWGLLNTDSKYNEMGPDSAWYARLEDAFRQSMMWDGDMPDEYEIQ